MFYTKIIYTNNDLHMPRRGPKNYTRVDFGRLRECMASMEPLTRFPDPPQGNNREEWKQFFSTYAKQIFAWIHNHPGADAPRPRLPKNAVVIRSAFIFLYTWYTKADTVLMTFHGINTNFHKLACDGFAWPIPHTNSLAVQIRKAVACMRHSAMTNSRQVEYMIPEFMLIKHFIDIYDKCKYLHGHVAIEKATQPAQPAQPAQPVQPVQPAQPAMPDLYVLVAKIEADNHDRAAATNVVLGEMKRQRDEMVEEMRNMKRQHTEAMEEIKKLRNEMREHAAHSQAAPPPPYGYPPPYYYPYYAYGNPAAPPTPRSDGM